MTSADPRFRVRWLGRVAYDEGLDLQRAVWESRSTGRINDDYLLLLEHPHTYTVGRNGDGSNLRVDPSELESIDARLVFTDRGGDITYHGPGQLVGYPIVKVPTLADGWDDQTPGDARSHGISRHPDDALDLDAALANLPTVSRAVVWLHDVEGFTHKEIADAMGKTESFSKSQLSRAYQRLRPMLDAGRDEPGAQGATARSF